MHSDQRNGAEQAPMERKIEAVCRLAAGVAHDYNNLLTVISGNVELLLAEEGRCGRQATELEEVASAARRAANLTHQLLAFSRQQHLEPRHLDAGILVQSQRETLQRIAGLRVQIEMRRDPAVGTVLADPGQLASALQHLIANARDAMPAGGTIRIGISNVDADEAIAARNPPMPPGPYVLLAVADSGIGMDTPTLARAFEPFFTTRPRHGEAAAGMGLAAVYGIVKQSGGFIFAESVVGRGTIMRVYLPRTRASAGATSRVKRRTTPRPGPRTVLVVEDEALVRTLVRRTLERDGFRVYEAANAHEALNAARALGDALDVMMSDIVMPGMRGSELASMVERELPHVAIILMSGQASEADVAREGTASHAFLPKPFTVDELRERVRGVLAEAAVATA